MIWKSKSFHALETLYQTGFIVSVTSYVIFWTTDLLIPGFVSRYFSVHLFLAGAIVFGLCWSLTLKEYEERPWLQLLVAILLGILALVIVWKSGEDLGGYRVLVVAVALLTPSLILKLLRE